MKEFIDAPVKTYSSGMYMRLGFAVAIHVDPDVLLVDEVLAVGDEGFTHKCLDKFAEFKRRGKTILLVTHSLGLVERFCDEALWLDAGRDQGLGRSQARSSAPTSPTSSGGKSRSWPRPTRGRASRRRRDGVARRAGVGRAAGQPGRDRDGARRHVPRDRGPLGIARSRDHRRDVLVGADGAAGHVFHSGERLDVRIRLRAPLPIDDFVVRRRHLQRRRASAATAPTRRSRSCRRAPEPATRKRSSRSTRSISSKAPTSWTSRSTRWTATRTTITGCSTRSA